MMNGTNDSLAFEDEDRLPWLEPAYDDDQEEEVSLVRLGAFILAGLALLGLIVGGVYLLRNYLASNDDPQVIAAPDESFKVPAEDADDKTFEGEGDSSFATSEGLDRDGKIDASRLPEAPVTAAKGLGEDDKAQASVASAQVKAPVQDKTGEADKPAPVAPKSTLSGPVVQLGAYPSDAVAREAWTRLSKRFDYLADLSHSIEPAVVGGVKYYRLRVAAQKDASTLCGKLKVAGEKCNVVN
ncbi:MAG: SPOR domain-containing protein [Sphingobium sp.]